MKKIVSIFIALLLIATSLFAAINVKAENEYKLVDNLNTIKLLGRSYVNSYVNSSTVFKDTICSPWLNDGIEFNADCSGKIVINGTYNGRLDTQFVYFVVYIDGVRQDRISTGIGSFSLIIADNLSQGIHNIKFIKTTSDTRIYLDSITMNGTFLQKPDTKIKKIEFIGDSITAGYGVYGDPGTGRYSPEYSDSSKTYAYIAAQNLNTESTCTAVSGYTVKGMLNYYRYRHYLGDSPSIPYEPTQKANVVVINLGTNGGNADEKLINIIPYVQQLVAITRGINGNVPVVWAYNMMSDQQNTFIKTALDEIGGESAGLYMVKLTRNNKGANGHPSLEGHQTAGDELSAFITQKGLLSAGNAYTTIPTTTTTTVSTVSTSTVASSSSTISSTNPPTSLTAPSITSSISTMPLPTDNKIVDWDVTKATFDKPTSVISKNDAGLSLQYSILSSDSKVRFVTTNGINMTKYSGITFTVTAGESNTAKMKILLESISATTYIEINAGKTTTYSVDFQSIGFVPTATTHFSLWFGSITAVDTYLDCTISDVYGILNEPESTSEPTTPTNNSTLSVLLDGVSTPVEKGTNYTFPALSTNGVAYTDGTNYYNAGDKITVNQTLVLTTVNLNVSMCNGAAMRIQNEYNGIRYYTKTDIDTINALKKATGITVSMGTLIAPKDLLGEDELTLNTDKNKMLNVAYEAKAFYKETENEIVTFEGIVGSIIRIKESNTDFSLENGNINREFIGRGYVTVTFGIGDNAKSKTIYANYSNNSIDNNKRSLGYLANAIRIKNDMDYINNKTIVDRYADRFNR